MLRTKVKASAVTNLTDARYFAAMEVEWLGFRLDGPPDSSISLLAAKAISEWVDGVKIVGEFEFPTAEEIETANGSLPFDAVQVGMFTPIEELKKLPNITFFKEVVVESSTTDADLEAHFETYAACCTRFLLDFSKSAITWADLQTSSQLSIGFLKSLFAKHKTIVAMDAQPGELVHLLDSLNPEGISLVGGSEEKVGFKSFEELDDIFECLEIVG